MKRLLITMLVVGGLLIAQGCAGVEDPTVGTDPITGEQLEPQTSTTGSTTSPQLNPQQKDDSAVRNGRLKEQPLLGVNGPTPTPVNTKVQQCDPNDFSCNGKKIDPAFGEPDPWKGSDDDKD